MTKEYSTTERIRGVLIGCAAGDAMGMPTEFWSNQKIKKTFPNGITDFLPSQKDDFIGRTMAPGEVTDDTINTIMITKMLIQNQGVLDAESYITELSTWITNSPVSHLLCGPSTIKAINAIEKGTPIEEAGKFGSTNGAAMKIAPIGFVADYQDMQELAEKVHQICLPTHNTSIAIAGATAVAAAVSYVVSGGQDLSQLWSIAQEAIQVGGQFGNEASGPSLALRMDYAKKLVETKAKEEVLTELYEFLGTTVSTLDTIPAVFAIVQLAQGDPMEAARLGATIGGDTDTIGAISGAICGGYAPEFTREVVELLETSNDLAFTELAEGIRPFTYQRIS